MIVRPASREGAEYRITLSTREATLQTSWSVYSRRMVGLRLAVGVAAGKPVLRFEQLGFLDWFLPEPVRLPGVAVSLDVSAGLVVRAGPVRLGPLVAVHTVWLRDARGYTVNEDVPYTTPTHVHATGLGFWIGALLHPRLLLSIDTRAYVQQRLPGASLRLGLAASWPAGEPRAAAR